MSATSSLHPIGCSADASGANPVMEEEEEEEEREGAA